MKIYIFDPDQTTDRRQWEKFLPLPVVRVNHDSSGFFVGQSNVLWESGVIIAHQANDLLLGELEKVVNSCNRLSCIVISGEAQERTSVHDRMYFRRHKVGRPDDSAFAGYFREFWGDLLKSDARNPNFSLLEPTAVPASLLAYTVAVQYRLQIPNIQELSAKADACYDQIQPYAESLLSKTERGPISSPEVRVPSRAAFESETPGDPNGTRFKAMRNVIELLREDM